MTDPTAFIGTYTHGDSEGIYRCRDSECTIVAESTNPSYLCPHPSAEYLYAVNEIAEGSVTAFEIGSTDGLTPIDERVIGPADPCHCQVDATGQWLFVAHYSGGAISVVPIDADGYLGEPTVIDHDGSSVDPERQAQPHPHTIRPDPENEHVYVADLGTDEIVRYAFDDANGSLRQAGVTSVHDGAGPRQFDFGPDGRLYCINELDSTLSVFDIESDGDLAHVETVGTVPADYDGDNGPGAIEVHPSGQYVYGSNRGHDSVVAFEVTSAGLERIECRNAGGHWPRDFAIDPTGERLHVANADSDSIVTLDIDTSAGGLTEAGKVLDVPDPVCVLPR